MSNKYFIVMHGLRGCYMPDSTNVYAFDSRRALKSYLYDEARDLRDANYVGLGDKNISWAAAHAWAKGDTILPYGFRGQGKPYAIEFSPITRKEYLERQKDEANA